MQTRRGDGTFHADAFCAFLGDALAVLRDAPPEAETPSLSALLR
ncbi:hypothetical protein [Sabulicella glaciei]|uniref:Uncharacterized protein n=1 Tax=Sabulicella glaciei TaxID=2984948 RepID=A0ABT3NSC2_9PROT|nr:hypothetical protein [Roseococcus sp. MDT2-1-1]MCW8085061.1 hypothetical protein [Roseococcus sp. MDT2-1-1]